MKRPTDTDWRYFLSTIVIVGAMLVGNGWWLLLLFLIWSSYD
jgi:hypothetical protein